MTDTREKLINRICARVINSGRLSIEERLDLKIKLQKTSIHVLQEIAERYIGCSIRCTDKGRAARRGSAAQP